MTKVKMDMKGQTAREERKMEGIANRNHGTKYVHS